MSTPVLYHLEVSHYNEKVRWALDYKGIPHERRAPMPITHMATAYRLARVKTFPVLKIDGKAIGDSTRIIAEVERRYPEPPLYPDDPQERRRALDLEDFFDEELGPHIRIAVFHELTKEPELFSSVAAPNRPRHEAALLRVGAPVAARMAKLRYGMSEEAARVGREKTVAAMDRVAAELGPSGYLAGDRFSVADLTAAALLYPIAMPKEMPYLPEFELPESLEQFAAPLRDHPAHDWVLRMYAEHRGSWIPA
jgi:glutathione S-transferase